MPKPKKQNKKEEEIQIKTSRSSLGEFVKRELPSDEEVEKFDEFTEEEVREEDIEESLSEIYQSDKGDMVNVRELEIKKSRGFFFRFFKIIFLFIVVGAIGYGLYYLYFEKGASSGDIKFAVIGKDNIIAGEEFFYTVNYKNLSNIVVKDIEIKLVFPENFIFLDSIPAANTNNDFWKIELLDAHRSSEIKIKGKIIGPKDKSNIITGSMIYTPLNFSSEFKKETTFKNSISGTGIEIDVEAPSGVLVAEESEILVKYKKSEENYLNSFRLTIEPLENMDITLDSSSPEEEGSQTVEYLGNGTWKINEMQDEEEEINIKFKINEKINQNEELNLVFEYGEDLVAPDGVGGQVGEDNYFIFYEEKIDFEVIKSDLNLNLIINGSRNDQGVDLGQTLNYSIVYANKGETEMSDVVIMVVLDSDVFDWESLEDENNGQIGEGIISWSKEEILEFSSLDSDAEGIIDFSIKIKGVEEIDVEPGGKYEVKSYAQFSIGNIEAKENEDTKSNTIVNKINSDLALYEQVRYFSDDNIAVGSGPLPPKVGEKTSYKVYWNLTNNLHELNNLQILVDLPEYVKWDNKNRSTVGTVLYNEATNKVIWNIGRLPISVYKAEAEFNISIVPIEGDIDTIMVLLSGTLIEAVDKDTGSTISKIIKAKTTKLEDDDIAETDGRIVK